MRPDAVPLELVGHGEGHLGHVVARSDVDGVRHRPAALRHQQAEPVPLVDVGHALRHPVQVGRGREEPQRPGLRREAREELPDDVAVVGMDRPDVHGGTVTQRDVGLTVRRVRARLVHGTGIVATRPRRALPRWVPEAAGRLTSSARAGRWCTGIGGDDHGTRRRLPA